VHYPERLAAALRQLQHLKTSDPAAISGSGGAFKCGCAVRIELETDAARSTITDAGYTTNGCGYMLAAAESVCREIVSKSVTDLGGADDESIYQWVSKFIVNIPTERSECVRAVCDALHAAFHKLRARRISEYVGELPLVCTCFGVTEQAVHDLIAAGRAADLDDVGRLTNAGTGCGSCRMLIDEMFDKP